jgi:hypothetical protein
MPETAIDEILAVVRLTVRAEMPEPYGPVRSGPSWMPW